MELGEYIKRLRTGMNMKQAPAARALDMTPQQLNDLEAGRVVLPSAPRLAKLAAFYGVRIEQLLNPPPAPPTRAVELLTQARGVLQALTRLDNQAQEAYALIGLAMGELTKGEDDDGEEGNGSAQAQGAL